VSNPMRRTLDEDARARLCKYVQRNTSIKEVSMGIYAGVNSRQHGPASLLVLCSRLTSGLPSDAIIKQRL